MHGRMVTKMLEVDYLRVKIIQVIFILFLILLFLHFNKKHNNYITQITIFIEGKI